MSNLSGVVDMLDEHPPSLTVTPQGTVLLSVDDSLALRFRTLDAFDAWLEDIDRQRTAEDADIIHLLRRSVEQAEIRKLHRGAS